MIIVFLILLIIVLCAISWHLGYKCGLEDTELGYLLAYNNYLRKIGEFLESNYPDAYAHFIDWYQKNSKNA